LKLRNTTLIRTTPSGFSSTSGKSSTTSGASSKANFLRPCDMLACLLVMRKLIFLSQRPLFPSAIFPLLFEAGFILNPAHKAISPRKDFWPAPPQKRPETPHDSGLIFCFPKAFSQSHQQENLLTIRPGAVDICRPMMVRYFVIYGVTR
jgi:hypothetical protein